MEEKVRKICEEYTNDLFVKDKAIGSYEDVVNTFAKCANKCLKSQWIDVKDALPELGEDVVIMDEDGNCKVAHRTAQTWGIKDMDFAFSDSIGECCYHPDIVKCWIYIPKRNK